MKSSVKAKSMLAMSFVIWGSIGVFVQMIPLNSGLIAFDRSIVGMLFLLVVKLCMKSKISFKKLKSSFGLLCVNGALLGINWILLFEAYKFTSVATGTICYNLGPMIVVLLSPIFFKEHLSVVKILCVLVSLFGIVCVSGIFSEQGAGESDVIGVTLGVMAAVVYAATVIINKRVQDVDPMDKAIVQFASSTVVMFVYSLFVTDVSELSFDVKTIVLLVVVGVVHTGIAYTVYFKSLPDVTSQNVAIFAYIDPVVAVILSVTVLNESINEYVVIGAVCVIVSALVSELYDNQQKKHLLQG